ncbi:MAG TPA: hypothetical protein VHK90_05700 [Thermoanaerobaculia bacterium]|nr:hypothetical protein [Thermoanaerobaculia bacterium]
MRNASWLVTALTGAYVLWSSFMLTRRLPAFAETFRALGAELPMATRIVLAAGKPAVLWPVAIAVVALLIVKELRVERTETRIALSAIVFMITALIMAVATEAVFAPMLRLIEQVG